MAIPREQNSVSSSRRSGAMVSVALLFCFLAACAQAEAQESSKETVFQTSRKAHRVTGWEQGLIKKTPNLSKYYWTPLTEYSQGKGSRKTGRGAHQTSGPVQTARRYVKPKFAPLPVNDRIQFSANEIEHRTEASGKVRFEKSKNQLASGKSVEAVQDCSAVLTYGDDKSGGYGAKSEKLSVSGKLFNRKK